MYILFAEKSNKNDGGDDNSNNNNNNGDLDDGELPFLFLYFVFNQKRIYTLTSQVWLEIVIFSLLLLF